MRLAKDWREYLDQPITYEDDYFVSLQPRLVSDNVRGMASNYFTINTGGANWQHARDILRDIGARRHYRYLRKTGMTRDEAKVAIVMALHFEGHEDY